MTLTRIPNHSEIAVGRLLQQFCGKPRLEGWLRAYIDEVQELEDMWFDVLVSRWLDNAAGAQLDVIGRIVERERLGLDDDEYRVVLRAWIRANRAEGTGDDILDVFSIANANKNDVELIPYYPAAFVLEVADALTDNVDLLAELVAKARAGGVRGFIHYTLVDDADTFQFASGDTAEADANAGFTTNERDAERVLNGDFTDWTADDPDDWTVIEDGSVWRCVSETGTGEAQGGPGSGSCNIRWTGGTPMPEIRQTLSLATGAPYQVSVNISYIEGNRNLVLYAAGEFTEVFSSIGVHTFIFTAVSSSPLLRVYLGPGTSGQITFDDITITASGGAWADAMES